jgi:hypothetical protein
MRTHPVLTYAHAEESAALRLLRALAVAVLVLSLGDVAVKVYTRGAIIDTGSAFFGASLPLPLMPDAVATWYYGRYEAVVRDARYGALATLAVISAIHVATRGRQRRHFSDGVVLILTWFALAASFLVPTKLWYTLFNAV